ncbi:hypothetical protein JZY06_05285, partial [Corynebacterium sp. CCM 8862]|nr:hypothetical protein [Corynebacterium mendelii]
MSDDHAIRVIVKVCVPDSPQQPPAVDMALPVQARLADILDEVLELAGSPITGLPWRAHTAAGLPVDPAVPLAHTALRQGETLIVSPHLSFGRRCRRSPVRHPAHRRPP